MEGMALERWNAMRGAQEQAFEQMCQQNMAYTQNKLLYHRTQLPQIQAAAQAPQVARRQPPKLKQLNQGEAYRRTCNKAQKHHNERIAKKNEALQNNGAQPTQYVRDRTPKKKVTIKK